ncbi:MAG: hypothetical protein JO345_34290 [Streptosporangiaceae bacterium]|nr:hypothetical protein [Streptosporangiaceae bacterium]
MGTKTVKVTIEAPEGHPFKKEGDVKLWINEREDIRVGTPSSLSKKKVILTCTYTFDGKYNKETFESIVRNKLKDKIGVTCKVTAELFGK